MVMLRASESAEQKEDWKKASAKTKNITQTSKASLASFELGLDGLCVWNSCGAHLTLKLFLNAKIQSSAPALRKLGVFIWDDADRRTSLHGWKCDPLQKAEKVDWDLVFWSGTIPWTLVAQRSEKMGGSVRFVTDFLSYMPCMLVLQRSVFPDHVGSKLDVGHASTHSKHSNQYQSGDISLPFVSRLLDPF